MNILTMLLLHDIDINNLPPASQYLGIVPNTGLRLFLVQKSDMIFSSLYRTHYPNSEGIIGKQLCFLILQDDRIIGIISAASPPRNNLVFKDFFCANEFHYLNNTAFRLLDHTPNLGTQVLKLFRQKVKTYYQEFYGIKLLGLCTFVEPPRSGAVYKADNWTFLGMTKGWACIKRSYTKTSTRNNEFIKTIPKLIFARYI